MGRERNKKYNKKKIRNPHNDKAAIFDPMQSSTRRGIGNVVLVYDTKQQLQVLRADDITMNSSRQRKDHLFLLGKVG